MSARDISVFFVRNQWFTGDLKYSKEFTFRRALVRKAASRLACFCKCVYVFMSRELECLVDGNV